MSVESYKHKHAKAILSGWLRDGAVFDDYTSLAPLSWRVNRGAPHFGIWEEYPIAKNGRDWIGIWPVWDEYGDDWQERPPTYAELSDLGMPPSVIFDVAVQHKGSLIFGIEIVHRHGITPRKSRLLREFGPFLQVYTIPAEWIMCQVGKPEHLVLERVL